MTDTATQLLAPFESLSADEQHVVLTQMLRCCGELPGVRMSDDALIAVADEVFQSLQRTGLASGPSVIQVRGQNVLPDHMVSIVVAALKQHTADLVAGALVVVDESQSRVRVLPI